MKINTLEEIRAMAGLARVNSANAYIEYGQGKVNEARSLRDEAVTSIARRVGLAEAARQTGLSVSSVRMIRGRS